MLIAPLPVENPFPIMAFKPMAAIFITDPDKVIKPPPLQLQEKFGLTPAEANFATEIAKGDGIRQPPTGFQFRVQQLGRICLEYSIRQAHSGKRS